MRLSSLLVPPATLLAGSFFACGGRVDDPGSGQPGPGPTGTGTISPTGSPTGTGTSTPPGTPTGSPTGTATTEPVPPSPSCVPRTNDRLDVAVTGMFTGSCSAAKPGGPAPAPLDFSGQILKVSADTIAIDTCPPTADCIASLTYVSAKAAGLDLSTLPVNSLVRVRASFMTSWACVATISIESLADWYGMKNPVDVGGLTYLSAVEGGTAVPGGHFSIDLVATGCGTKPGDPGCGGTSLPIGDYAMAFSGAGSGGSVSIPMGSSARFVANGQVLEARNLRAFYAGWCDEYWDYAYWAKASYGFK